MQIKSIISLASLVRLIESKGQELFANKKLLNSSYIHGMIFIEQVSQWF